jgi:pyruvate dehydrogenase E2 component (dihydrolipoamide acetyltransferase)
MSETQVLVPDIGDVESVDVVEVLVQPGASVTREQGLIVLESDKASMEVPSPAAGTVREVKVKVGDKVSKGALIMLLESGDGAQTAAPEKAAPTKTNDKGAATPAPAAPAPATPAPATPAPATPAPATPAPATPAEAADEVSQDNDVREEADLAPQHEPEATGTGASAALKARASAPERPQANAGVTRTIPPPPPPRASEPPPKPAEKPAHATPAVRQLARELGVDLRQVSGTGPHARVTREDVQGYVKHAMSAAGSATGVGFAVPQLPEIDFSQFGEVRTEPLTKIQKLTGRNTHRSWVTIPHVTQHDEADITELEAFRQKMRAERPDVKLTLTAFFVKALGVMLKHMPRFNASLDKSGENLILKNYFNIGVAVDTPNGLVVPVIRDVDQKGLSELAIELAQISERARGRKLMPQDMQGASMTVSSLGGIGGTFFTPIINPPEVAVLGVSRATQRPVYIGGKLEPRLIVGLSLSYDHRVIDGADGVRFTSRLREVLSDIREMLL